MIASAVMISEDVINVIIVDLSHAMKINVSARAMWWAVSAIDAVLVVLIYKIQILKDVPAVFALVSQIHA